MANKIIENKIIQLSIDDARLTRGLTNAMKGLTSFDKSVNNIKGTGIDNVGKSAESLGSKISGMISHIPVVGKVSTAILGIGKSAIQSALHLGGIGNNAGFSSISGQASSASSAVEGIGNSASNAAGGFNVLAGAASVALGGTIIGLANKAADVIKNFTIAPISDGFKEYEEELQSARILMSALGDEAAPKIRAVMADLENYAGTTRYSVQTMNSTVAQLVNAGVDIDDAGTAIKGWGNLAASAGASTNQFASSLQFGVQQAMAMGKMTAQNWLSVENANMATEKFKRTLMDVGEELGENVPEDMGQFRESLETGWVTTEVMVEAMSRLAADKSLQELAENVYSFGEAMEVVGEAVTNTWSKVWRNILGEGKDTAKIWSPFAEALGGLMNAPGQIALEFSNAFYSIGGSAALVTALFDDKTGILHKIQLTLRGVKEGIKDVLPEFDKFINKSDMLEQGASKPLVAIMQGVVDGIKKMGENFKINPAVQEAIRSITAMFVNLAGIIGKITVAAGKVFVLLFPDHLIQNGIILVGIFASLVNGVINFGKALLGGGDTSKFTEAFDRLSTAVGRFWDAINNALGAVGNAMSAWSRHTGDSIDKTETKFSVLDLFVGIINKLADGVTWLTDVFSGLGKSMSGISMKPINDLLKAADKIFKMPHIKMNNPFKTLTASADEITIGKKVDTIGGHLGRASKDAEKTDADYTEHMGRVELVVAMMASKLGMDIGKVHEYWTSMSTTLHDVGDNITKSIEVMKERFTAFFDVINFTTVGTFFSSTFKVMGEVFKWFGDVVSNSSGPAMRVLEEFIKLFDTFLKGINMSSLLDLSQLILVWKVINKLDGSGDIIDKLQDKITRFKEALMFWKKGDVGFLGEIKDTMQAYQRQLKAQALKEIAKAILLIAAAMFTLSLIPANKVGQVAKLMMVLAGSLSVLAVALGLMQKLSGSGAKANPIESLIDKLGFPELKSLLKKLGTAAMILSLAGAVVLIAKTFNILTKFDWGEIGKALTAVGAIMIELTVLSRLAGKGASLGDAAKILALAYSVKQMVGLVKILNEIDYATLTDGLTKLAAIGLVMGGMLALMGGKAKVPGLSLEWGQVNIGTAATILALSYGIKMMVGVVKELGTVPLDDLAKGTIVIAALGAVLAGCVALLGGEIKTPGGVSVSLGKVKFGAILGLVAMTLSIKALAGTVQELGTVPVADLAKGTTVVSELAIVLAAVVSLMGLRFEYFGLKVALGKMSIGAIAGIIVTTLGLMGLAYTVAKLADIPKDKLQYSLDVVKMLAVVIAALVIVVGNFANMSVMDVGGMLVTVGGLVLLAGTLMKLTEYSWEDIKKGMAGISVVALAMVGVMAASKLVDVTGMAGMLIAAGSIYLLAEKMQELAQIPAETLKNAEIAIGVIALCMMGIMGASAIVTNPMSIVAMIAAAAAIVAIGYSMKQLASIDLVSLAAATAAVVIALGAIVIAAVALTYTGAIIAVVALAASLVGVGIAAVLFGIGANLVVDALTKLWELIKVVAADLGTFFLNLGTLIGSGISAIGPALGQVWSNITKTWNDFWKDASKWGDKLAKSIGQGISDAKDWVVQKAKDIWNAIVNFWNGGKEKVKESGKDTGNKYGEGIGSAKGSAEGQAGSVRDGVKGKLGDTSGMKDAGSGIISNWWSGLTSTYNSIIDKAKAMGDTIKSFFTGGEGGVGDFMENGVTKYVAGLENFIGDVTLSPVIKPELDMSSIDSLANRKIISAPLEVQYNNLNTATAQMSAQQNNISTIMHGMESIYETIGELVDVNNTQANLLARDRTNILNVDGDRMTNKLAPKMTGAIETYNQDIDRRNGKLADLR